MAKPYVVKKGDTLARIAEATLGDRKLAARLADYNGLASVKDIVVGQAIHLISKADLPKPGAAKTSRGQATGRPGKDSKPGKTSKTSKASIEKGRKRGVREVGSDATATATSAWPAVPDGQKGIIETFGDIRLYVRDDGTADPRWEAEHIARAKLPFPIPLDWDTSAQAKAMQCHKLLVPLFESVFAEIVAKGLQSTVKTYGGGYNWRMKRGQAKPSTHSWGIAIDLNVRTNGMGTAGDMDPRLVELFEARGFLWGGRWSGANKDPMHFQYCTGY